jgi:hypothetical protein
LPTIGAMLIAVVLDGDFDLFPTHVKVGEDLANLIEHWDLRARPWQACLDQHDA